MTVSASAVYVAVVCLSVCLFFVFAFVGEAVAVCLFLVVVLFVSCCLLFWCLTKTIPPKSNNNTTNKKTKTKKQKGKQMHANDKHACQYVVAYISDRCKLVQLQKVQTCEHVCACCLCLCC